MKQAPPTEIESGVLDLILGSGPVVQLVLLTLLASSVLSWTIIVTKYRLIRTSVRQNGNFLKAFWKSKSMDEIFHKTDKFKHSNVGNVFKAGFQELKKMSPNKVDSVENIYRALSRSTNEEMELLEKNVGWLATVASATPFIGLFGTVWGIMNAFQNIGATGGANLAIVAPGISEALIATAAGLAAAIPAVIAYNHFAAQIKKIGVNIENFNQDFLNILQRSLIGGRKK